MRPEVTVLKEHSLDRVQLYGGLHMHYVARRKKQKGGLKGRYQLLSRTMKLNVKEGSQQILSTRMQHWAPKKQFLIMTQ